MVTGDAQGFVVGVPLDSAAAVKLLKGMRGDTAKILAILQGSQAPTRTATPAGRRQAATAAAKAVAAALPAIRSAAAGRAVATPVPRSFVPRQRDAQGRFVGASSRAETADRMLAEAAQAVARTTEQARRDANGRFTAGQSRRGDGQSGQGGGMLGQAGSRIGESAGAALRAAGEGNERLDPALQAAAELKQIGSQAAAVVAPLGRGLFGSRSEKEGTGWLRRMWRELRAMRTADARASRDHLKALKDANMNRGAAGGSLGLLGLLGPGGMLGAAGIGGAIGAAAGALLPALAGLLMRGVGVIGAAMAGWKLGGAIYDRYATQIQDGIERITVAWSDGVKWVQETFEPARKLFTDLSDWVMNLPGMNLLRRAPAAAANAGQALANAGGEAVQTGRRTLSQAWEAVRGLIVGAGDAAGVDPGLLAKIARKESRFNANARPMRNGVPMSSAHGLGQFIDGTWHDTVRKHGEKYGVAGASRMTKEQTAALRGDAALQAAMLAELTKENAAIASRIDGSDQAANVYALHNLGRGSGSKFLRALQSNPNARVSDVLSAAEIRNNPSLYGDGSLTLQQAYGRLGKAMSGGAQFAEEARMLSRQAVGPRMPGMGGVPAAPQPPAIPPTPDMPAMPSRVSSPPAAASAPVAIKVPQDVPDRPLAHVASGGISGSMAHR